MDIVNKDAKHQKWVKEYMKENWGSTLLVSRGKIYNTSEMPALIAIKDGNFCGLLVYREEGEQIEIMSIDAMPQFEGIGTQLINSLKEWAIEKKFKRIWLITTNDNVDALRFYQRRGFSLVKVHKNAVTEARRLKPSIPLIGYYNIPIKDEIELELLI